MYLGENDVCGALLWCIDVGIDNQRNGLETQAKVLMTFVIRPDTLYFGTLCNFEMNIFQDFAIVLTYLKKRRPYLQNYRLFKLFLKVKYAENHH